MPLSIRIRVDDAVSIDGPWWTVWRIDEANDRVVLRDAAGNEQEWSLAIFTDACRRMTHGVRARIAHPVMWLPMPVGYAFYGEDKGYLPVVIGGYVKDEHGNWVPHPDPDGFMATLHEEWAKEQTKPHVNSAAHSKRKGENRA